MNFALFLCVAIIVTGLISLLDKLYLHPKRLIKHQKTPWLISEAKSFFPILVLVFFLRSFLIEPFRIPSSSLEPTLFIGDFVAVNKFAYGIRIPIIEKKIIDFKTPKRGDIVVFRWPPNPKFDFIKRVIGLPGDKIAYRHKQLWINDQPVALESSALGIEKPDNFKELIEHLPGQTHHILQRTDSEPFDFEITVPKNYYFVMGDNRDDSADSRYWGFVHDSHLRGQAMLIWMSWDSQHYRIRFNRIGRVIH